MKKINLFLLIVGLVIIFLIAHGPHDIIIGRIGGQDESSRNALFRINKLTGQVYLYNWVADKWVCLGKKDSQSSDRDIRPILFRPDNTDFSDIFDKYEQNK